MRVFKLIPPPEMPTINSLIVAMSVEDLRSFKQVPAAIRLEASNGTTTSTIGSAGNVAYFT